MSLGSHGTAERPPCQREGTILIARWRIPAVGSYRVLGISAGSSAPPPTGSFDQDLATLMKAGSTLHYAVQQFDIW